MKILSTTALSLFLTTAAIAHQVPGHGHATLVPIPAYTQPYGEASGSAALKAAEAFLATFDEEAKAGFMFDLDAANRAAWSNLPAGIVKRTGVSIGELSDQQRALLFEFLASSLGEEGYESVAEVLAAEAFLSTDRRAAQLKWAPENYWVSFYGTPSANAPWGWQFGGHHLALNLSIEGNKVETMSPSFIGTEPAVFTINGVDYEAVRDMHLSGYEVFTALDADQKVKANAGAIPEDVLTGPGQDGTIPQIIGISAAEMTTAQQEKLLDAINEWVSVQPNENAKPRMQELAEGIGQISYAWTGTDEVNTPTYMRIQGPTLIIEMLSTGGNVGSSAQGAGHYHTIYRNPKFEYGQ
ncbi:DUF3500 domain-containing protein [Phaeobacter sp. CNT1-3]|nr:DUF3500 domain-containing protein [Phaeobacter sp. CNT1-3]